jgi:hypothetical protein
MRILFGNDWSHYSLDYLLLVLLSFCQKIPIIPILGSGSTIDAEGFSSPHNRPYIGGVRSREK